MGNGHEEADRGKHVRPAVALVCLVTVGCATDGSETEEPQAQIRPNPFEAPVATNADPPVAYPIELFEQGIEGTVILRLYADETGVVVPDSTEVAESSGYPQFDSAALTGVEQMTFAPARREGIPVPTSFYQPVYFRVPDGIVPGDRP